MPSQAPAETQSAPIAPKQAANAAPQNGGDADLVGQRRSTPRFALPFSAVALRRLTPRLSHLIATATVVVIALIALGIVFHVLDANTHKWVVSDVERAARWFAGPFDNTFMVHSAKLAIALNWGIAIVVFAILGRLAARLVQKLPDVLAHKR
jgi:hypothetical protein